MTRSTGGLVCAVDVGTSAVRAALVAPDGAVVASGRRERHWPTGGEFDVDRLWADVVDVLAGLGSHPRAADVAGVGIAGHVGAVVVDSGGEPLCPGVGWSDSRGVDILARIWSRDDAVLRRVGRPSVTGGALPYLCWLREHRPELHRRVRGVLGPKDLLVARLTDTMATDETSAAYTLAFDVRARTWAAEAVEASGLDPDAFPPHSPGVTPVGRLTDSAASRTGLPTGTPVVAGGPDGTVGAALVAGVRTDVVVDVAGTTDSVTRISAEPVASAGSVLNPYVVPGMWSYGGPTGATGGAVTHICRLLGLTGLDETALRLGDDLAATPGAAGPMVVPSLTGSRFPDWRHDERASIVGMTDAHTPAHLVRAAAEAAAYLVRTGVDEVADAGEPVVLAGGVARSPEHAQLRADVFGRSVAACTEPDVSLVGAAALATVGAGLHADLASAARAMTPDLVRFEPEPGRAARYDELYHRWLQLRAAILAAGGGA